MFYLSLRNVVILILSVLVIGLPDYVFAKKPNRTDVYFGSPQVRLDGPVSVGKTTNLIFKVCAKSLDATSTVTTKFVAGELGTRTTTTVTITDPIGNSGTCRDVVIKWKPTITGFVNVTGTLNGDRAVYEGAWVFNNLVTRLVWVSN